MADAAVGAKSKISAAPAGTAIGSYTTPMEFLSESVKKVAAIIYTGGIRATFSEASERTVGGPHVIGGQVAFCATPTLLDYWLPNILGTAESTDVFALADTLPYFDLLVDRGGTKRFVYGNCKVTKAVFSHQSGQPLMMTLDIIGQSESTSATAFPTLADPTDPPYAFSQLVGTLVSSSRILSSIEVTIEHPMDVRFSNSNTATSIMPTGRSVTVKAVTPFTSVEFDLYDQTLLGSAGTLVWTSANLSTTFAFAALQVGSESPTTNGRNEVFLTQNYVARKSGSTKELVITNDSSP